MKERTDPRVRFFNETGGMTTPFVDATWRGCALDRDRFEHTRLPEALFNAIIFAAESSDLLMARYSPDSECCDSLPANWAAFRAYVFTEANWSLEYVLFDPSGRWAVLADADVTVFGAAPGLADLVDHGLLAHGTSLVQLTDTDFPGLDASKQPGAAYLLAVSGR